MKESTILPVMFALVIGICFLSAFLLADEKNQGLALTLKPKSATNILGKTTVYAGEISIENAIKAKTDYDYSQNGIKMKFITDADKHLASTSEIEKLILAKSSAISYCYDVSEADFGEKENMLKIKFLVGTKGRVEKCEILSSTFNVMEVEKCACKIIMNWKLPRFARDPMWISHEVIFSPAN